jgi:hypothetical protein
MTDPLIATAVFFIGACFGALIATICWNGKDELNGPL